MMEREEAKQKLLAFSKSSGQNKKRSFALRSWCERNPNYNFVDVFEAILTSVGDNFESIANTIDAITKKEKRFSRGSLTNGNDKPFSYVSKNEDGQIVIGDTTKSTPNSKGQHPSHSQSVIRKDGQVKKNVIASRERLYDLGAMVRSIDIFQDCSNEQLTEVLRAIKEYAKIHKISEKSVVQRLAKGKYTMNITDNGYEVVNSKTIQITESQINELNDSLKLTEYKFYNNVQRFLSDLLKDPVGAKVPFLLKANGIDRNRLLYHLKGGNIVNRHQKISDRDSEGNLKTAKMIIKYSVPKQDFAKKMKKLFIALVAKNVPEKIEKMINEDGEGGGAPMGTTNCQSSGQFSQPMFGVQRRKMPTDIEETTTTSNVGDYQYTVPFGGDKETLSRNDGEGGSTSINIVDEAMMRGFSYDKLKSISSFKGRFAYCKEMLGNTIGKGSSRAVFQINDGLCLKLAINAKGIAQNSEELNKAGDYMVPQSLIPKVFDEVSDEEGMWIVSEYVLPSKAKDFKEVLGVDFQTFQRFLYTAETHYRSKPIYVWMKMSSEEFNDLLEMDEQNTNTLNELYDYMRNYDLPVGDLTRIANWGIVKRYNEVNMVLLDNGLTDDIYNEFYRR